MSAFYLYRILSRLLAVLMCFLSSAYAQTGQIEQDELQTPQTQDPTPDRRLQAPAIRPSLPLPKHPKAALKPQRPTVPKYPSKTPQRPSTAELRPAKPRIEKDIFERSPMPKLRPLPKPQHRLPPPPPAPKPPKAD